MKSEEILESIREMRIIIKDDTMLREQGYTYKDMLKVNVFKEITLCLAYWHIDEIPNTWLECCMDATEDEYYTTITELVSNLWLEKANKEIEEICAEIEKATD